MNTENNPYLLRIVWHNRSLRFSGATSIEVTPFFISRRYIYIMENKTNFPQQCKKCGNTIFASPCHYCNTSAEEMQSNDVNPLSQNKSTPSNTPKGNPSKNSKYIIFAVVALLFVGLIIGISQCERECKHEWKEATCTEPKTCAKCGETEGNRLWHDYVGNCEEYGRCTRCGDTLPTKYSHRYKGNCEEHGTCIDCGKTSPETLTHIWNGDIHTGAMSCSRCEKSITDKDISQTDGLSDVERAYIYWHLNRYLTARGSYGYLYTEDEAFQKSATQFSLSKSYLKNDFWGVNAVYNHNAYSKYYY